MDMAARPQPKIRTNDLGTATSTSFNTGEGTPSWRSAPSSSPISTLGGGPTPSTPLPPPRDVVPRSLTERESQLVGHLSRLQFFLATAPTRWMGSDDGSGVSGSPFDTGPLVSPHPNLNRFLLPNGEHVACVFWNGLYHITGTDIVRALVFRFEAFSRPVRNIKKFEEGVFSDLRNLKPGTDLCLEEPKSPFLDLLFRNGCIRTQKKQKVFYWFSVPHDRLFLDALERDLKREKMGLEPTTSVLGEPARSFKYDPKRSLFEQFAGKQPGLEDPVHLDDCTTADINEKHPLNTVTGNESGLSDSHLTSASAPSSNAGSPVFDLEPRDRCDQSPAANSVLFSRSLFEGSPAYKQGRKKTSTRSRGRIARAGTTVSIHEPADRASSDVDHPLAFDFPSLPNLENGSLRSVPFSQAGPQTYDEQNFGPIMTSSVEIAREDTNDSDAAGHRSSGPSAHRQNPLSPSVDYRVDAGARGAAKASPKCSPFHVKLSSEALSLHDGTETPAAPQSTGNPPKGFACPLLSCGRLFKRLEHLKRHVRTHTQERPYECQRCSKRFSRSDNLTQHIKTHEKADRGERLKTEASEITEDDIHTFIETEMDPLRPRHGQFLSMPSNMAAGSLDSLRHPVNPLSRNNIDASMTFSATPDGRIPGSPYIHPFVNPIDAERGGFYRGSSLNHEWTLLPGMLQAAQKGAFPTPIDPFGKRHRSMTPNRPPSATGIQNGQSRFHPYPAIAPRHQTHFNEGYSLPRATSLDPASIHQRASALNRIPGAAVEERIFEENELSREAIRFGQQDRSLSTSYPPSGLGTEGLSSQSLEPGLHLRTAEAAVPVHGLKDGADGAQIGAGGLGNWPDSARIE